ncbi:SDR family NAD(P)-dependent oxidoreductase [Bradyrhizobium tropiciagri]|uniref:SDR family NAD(P)-dependent oxidoreductase n=1 Tax=Bradyrhizobium tropiciagri TaxID=312253 RepID=UPI00067D7964|nr:SDR family NAD(P)-dependent oxidoreductase [Bradyrhizobium tropiciagri]
MLVNNAGVGRAGDIEQLSFDDWQLVIASTSIPCSLGAKRLLKYRRNNQPCSIINISSIAGLIVGAQLAGLQRLKAAVWLLPKRRLALR